MTKAPGHFRFDDVDDLVDAEHIPSVILGDAALADGTCPLWVRRRPNFQHISANFGSANSQERTLPERVLPDLAKCYSAVMNESTGWIFRPGLVAAVALLTGLFVAFSFLGAAFGGDQYVIEATPLLLTIVFAMGTGLGFLGRAPHQWAGTGLGIAVPSLGPTVLFVMGSIEEGDGFPVTWFYILAVIFLLAFSSAFLGAAAAKRLLR